MSPLSFPHGFFDGEWQKSPIPFGASGSIVRAWNNTNLAAGNNTINDSAVPDGEIWVITNIGMLYLGTSPGAIRLLMVSGVTEADLVKQLSPVSNQLYDRQTWLVMFPGDYLRLFVGGATAGDDAYGNASGFRIDTDQ